MNKSGPGLGMTAALLLVAVMLAVPLAIILSADEAADRETLHQFNTLDAFLDGGYDGIVSYSHLFTLGDTGLGTFHGVDGEMIAFDGRYYQIRWDGSIVNVTGDMTAPLAMVTFFDVDAALDISDKNLSSFHAALDGMRCSDNYIYVFVAKGTLESVTTRSFAPMEPPYPPLANATSFTFNASDVNGTLVIMWFPAAFSGLNLDAYHMHFLADDYSIGGHVTDLVVGTMTVEMDMTPGYRISLPLTEGFRDWQAVPGGDVE